MLEVFSVINLSSGNTRKGEGRLISITMNILFSSRDILELGLSSLLKEDFNSQLIQMKHCAIIFLLPFLIMIFLNYLFDLHTSKPRLMEFRNRKSKMYKRRIHSK